MREKKNLQKLLNLTRHSEQVKTHELSQRLAAQKDATERLYQLKDYLSEYQTGSSSSKMAELQNQRSFTLQLTQAITEQKQKTKQLEELLKPSYKNWMMAKQRREAVEAAITDYAEELLENEERQLQKDMETYAARNLKDTLQKETE